MSVKVGAGGLMRVVYDPDDLARSALDLFCREALAAVERVGVFTCCLSGGETPLGFFSLLGTDSEALSLPWDKIHVFWGDERCGASDAPDNHYYQAREAFLSRVGIPPENVHPIQPDNRFPEEAARDYDRKLHSFFRGKALPDFDWLLLGLGEDCHTASLYPGTPGLDVRDARWVTAHFVPQRNNWRITLTINALLGAARTVWLAAGTRKAAAVKRLLESRPDPDLAATIVFERARAPILLCDEAAASALSADFF